MKPTRTLSVLLAVGLYGLTASGAPPLAEAGKTLYTVVRPEKATEAELFAASELVSMLGKVIGGAVPLRNALPESGHPAIYLEYDEKLGPEEWRIVIDAQNVRISGGRPRGVLYGVYEFLERYAGVRFYSIEGPFLPKRPDLVLPAEAELRGNPAFRRRQIYVHTANTPLPAHYLHTVRLRMGVNLARYGFAEQYGTPGAGHTYWHYTKDFPAEIGWMTPGGERVKVTHAHYGNLCYSLPEVRRRVVEKLRANIASDRARCDRTGEPYPTLYSLGMNDANALCHCPECKAFAAKHNVSGLVLDFTNRIAAEIAKDHPEIKIMCFAYKDAVEPPKDGIVAADNVIVQVAHMDWEFHPATAPRDVLRGIDAPGNRAYAELLERWSKTAEHLAVWDYWKLYYDKFPSPKSCIGNRAGYLNKYRTLGVEYLFIEAEVDNENQLESFLDLRTYVAAKLMCDPGLDVNALTADFMQGFYGPAARPMTEYFQYLERRLAATSGYLGSVQPAQRGYLDSEFFTKAGAWLDEAEKAAAASPGYLRRVGQERLIFDIAAMNLIPDRVDRNKTLERIAANFGNYLRKYNSANFCKQSAAELTAKLLARFDRPAPPEQFKDKEIIDLTWPDFKSGRVSADPEAAGGKCIAFSNPKVNYSFAGKYPPHSRNMMFGIYDPHNKRYPARREIPKAELPQDEKYHLYHLGQAVIPPGAVLYSHSSWLVSVSLSGIYDVNFPDDRYDVYVSIKVQGPSYVPGSELPDDFRLDRVVLVRCKPRAQMKP